MGVTWLTAPPWISPLCGDRTEAPLGLLVKRDGAGAPPDCSFRLSAAAGAGDRGAHGPRAIGYGWEWGE